MLTKSFRISPHEGDSTTDDVENFVKSLSAPWKFLSPGKVGLRVQGTQENLDFFWFEETLFPLCDTYVDDGWDIRVVYEGESNYILMCGMYKNKAYDAEGCGLNTSEPYPGMGHELEFESFAEWEKEALPKRVEVMRKYLESKDVTCTDEDLTAYSDAVSSSNLMLYDNQGKSSLVDFNNS